MKGYTVFSQKVQKIIGIECVNKLKEQHKSAVSNKCYITDIPKNSSLYTINKIKKVIYLFYFIYFIFKVLFIYNI